MPAIATNGTALKIYGLILTSFKSGGRGYRSFNYTTNCQVVRQRTDKFSSVRSDALTLRKGVNPIHTVPACTNPQ